MGRRTHECNLKLRGFRKIRDSLGRNFLSKSDQTNYGNEVRFDFAQLNQELENDPLSFSIEDEKFDQLYPATIRQLSSVFWTPLAVAAEAAKLLVTAPGTRVLDIGCGPGKFCLIGASLTDGHFTGVEQRTELVLAAKEAASELLLKNAEFIAGNVMDVAFANYDAFYLFNPFEENMAQGYKIDSAVPLSPELFRKYTSHVSTELGMLPIGTRVVTYAGYADDIPGCYTCVSAQFEDDLKLWVKTAEYDGTLERFGLTTSRSYRGSAGWQSPRHCS